MSLDAGTLERLMYLRIQLREAQQRTNDRTHVGRHAAAILLDGACEHAMLLSLGHLGEAPGRSFHANFNALKERLGSSWQQDGWGGVDRLHGTRTEAQHRGTVPDADEFARWSADAERFINSLVAAAFDVDLQVVSTAQAVEASSVRTLLERAEDERNEGELEQSFRSSLEALRAARGLWESEREDAYGSDTRRPFGPDDLTADYVRRAVVRMDDLASIQPFAADLGEYIWLKSAERRVGRDLPFSEDDADRAIAFVVSWVLRWEAFSHRYTRDRATLKPATTDEPDAEPYIGSVEVEEESYAAEELEVAFSVRATVVDIPEAGADSWLAHLKEEVDHAWRTKGLPPEPDGPLRHRWISETGVIEFSGIADEAEARHCIDLAARAIAAAHQMWRDTQAAMAQSALDEDDLRRQFANAVAGITLEGEPLVLDTTVATSWVGRGNATKPVANITLSLRLNGDQHLWHEFWRALHDTGELAPGGGGTLDLLDDALLVPGSKAPADVADILARATQAVEASRQAARRDAEQLELRRRAVEEAARSRLSK